MRINYSVTAEIRASALFTGENINWRYCKKHATFVHKDRDACEFILHIGDGEEGWKYSLNVIAEMNAYGCSRAFINAYSEARNAGATRVLFYV